MSLVDENGDGDAQWVELGQLGRERWFSAMAEVPAEFCVQREAPNHAERGVSSSVMMVLILNCVSLFVLCS